jgi:hypothetical protein
MRINFRSKELPHITIKTNGKIKKAIDSYRKKLVPMTIFLTHYLAVKSKGDLLAEALNPWSYFFKGIEGHEIESGVSVEETLFNQSAMTLPKELPSNVINAAFYINKHRNDYDFEIGYLLPLFIETISSDDNVLIINPSPNMICNFEKSGRECRKKMYAVPDEAVAKLYKFQFPNSEFFPFEQLQNKKDFDSVLITNRDQKVSESSILLSCLSGCNDSAKVVGLIPNAWFDSQKNKARLILEENGFAIKQALLVDTLATNSTPKKKMLVFIEKGANSEIEVVHSSYDKKSRTFTVLDGVLQINAKLYLETNKTMVSCCNEVVLARESYQSPKYKKSEEYKFSKEISIFYKVYFDRKNKYAGVAYYREIKDANFRIWGKKITSDIEKGLRADSKEDVIKAIENIVFDDKIYPIIRTDIERKCLGIVPISLKTLWFYCWNSIVDSPKYEHDSMSRIFSNTDIADMMTPINSGEVILKALAKTFEIEVDEIPFRYVDQLNLLFKTALKLKLTFYNPMESYITEYSRRATERQQDVRNALVKKHFTDSEELSIFMAIVGNHITKKMNCVEKSLLLATAIRLFAGIAIREVAALKWKDFRTIDCSSNDYQFSITKFVDHNGKIIIHSEKQNWIRYRLVPSAKVLTALLLDRKQYLIENGVDEEYLWNCPIVLGEERILDMKKMKKIGHCKPHAISKTGNELIKLAKIPENIIVLPDDKNDLTTDFNRYHGDIFQTNFRDKVSHDAHLTNGEINYVIGIDAPDTFSRHYCDYTNDYIQVGIIRKLSRWELKYERLVTNSATLSPSFGEKEGNFDISVGPYENGVASVDIIIENRSDLDAEVTVKSFHGLDVNTVVYEVRNVKDKL